MTDKPAPNNYLKVAYAGVSFTALFTGFIAAQNVASSVYKGLGFNGLGEACVLTIYLFLALGSIIASYVKKMLSYRAGFVIGSLGYGSLVLASLITSTCSDKYDPTRKQKPFYCEKTIIYALNIGFSVLVGLGASIIWLTQSDYVNSAATEETKGRYNGLFWSLMQQAQILSSVLVKLLLSDNPFYLYVVLMGFVIVATVMFAFTPNLEAAAAPSVESMDSFGTSIGKFFKAFCAKRSTFLLPGMMLIGVAIAFYANFLGRVNANITADSVKNIAAGDIENFNSGRLGWVLIALALGEIAAGLTVGRMADKMNKITLNHWMIIVPEIGLVLTYAAYYFDWYPVLVGSGFMWGYTDTALNSIVGIIIGVVFGGSMEYFCLMRFFTGMGAAAGSLLAIAIPDTTTFTLITAVAIILLHLMFLMSKNDNIEQESKDMHEPLTSDV